MATRCKRIGSGPASSRPCRAYAAPLADVSRTSTTAAASIPLGAARPGTHMASRAFSLRAQRFSHVAAGGRQVSPSRAAAEKNVLGLFPIHQTGDTIS